jgi:REP element-mobilizing transposase RayT
MARKLRIEFAGACYHVINRGNYRRELFSGKGAAEAFEQCLAEAAERFGWRVHAYVVMSNHFHLVVETPEPNLSEAMKWLQGTWAARFNRFRGETGRPFQGRYKALHVELGEALGQVAHYIHLNPVRAGIVPPERLPEYRHSSLYRFLGGDRPAWLIADTVLIESGHLGDTAKGWKCYLEYLGVLAEEDARRHEHKFGRLSRGWAIGSAEFQRDLERELAPSVPGREGFELLGADREAQQQARNALWEETLVALAAGLRIDLNELPPKKSAADKVRLAAMMTQMTSVSNAWLARRLQMGVPGSVTQYVRRFRSHSDAAQADRRRVLSRIHT